MRISFDIDDTLVLHSVDAEPEPNRVPFLLRGIFYERLRKGTSELFAELHARGWEICVYTTSDRRILYLEVWLGLYGANIKQAINQQRHISFVEPRFRHSGKAPSKHPGLFGMALHIDDLPGVGIEGEKHGFRTLIIEPSDPDWVGKILSAVDRLSGENGDACLQDI